MRYLRVKNWSEFQHYKDRNPPWIKLHRTLLDDYEFSCLQDASKAHLMLIWLFASQKNGLVPDEPAFLKKKLGLEKEPNLKLLISHGLLIPEQDASNALAECEQVAPREESYKASDKTTEDFVIPTWVPQTEWKAFLEIRKGKKVQNTPRALKLLLTELERLKSLGFDPARVLDQSTLKSWTSVYPLKLELVSATAEPAAKLCDYCAKISTGTVNGRRSCEEHWDRAMGNERPARVAA